MAPKGTRRHGCMVLASTVCALSLPLVCRCPLFFVRGSGFWYSGFRGLKGFVDLKRLRSFPPYFEPALQVVRLCRFPPSVLPPPPPLKLLTPPFPQCQSSLAQGSCLLLSCSLRPLLHHRNVHRSSYFPQFPLPAMCFYDTFPSYAFIKRKEWIRLPSIIYSVCILSTCFLIVIERYQFLLPSNHLLIIHRTRNSFPFHFIHLLIPRVIALWQNSLVGEHASPNPALFVVGYGCYFAG